MRGLRNLPARILACASFGALSLLGACGPGQDSEYTQLFNGRDLELWRGDEAIWSVSDGAILGQSTAERPIPANTFLIYQGKPPEDFELRLEFLIEGDNENDRANSGVQYRSRILDESAFSVGGYQADMDFAGKWIGMLYEEKGRGLVMRPGDAIRLLPPDPDSDKKTKIEPLGSVATRDEILAAYNQGQWNELTIIADGNRLRHFLNDVPTAEVIDDHPEAARSDGVIALQLHRGPPMSVRFRNLRIKEL